MTDENNGGSQPAPAPAPATPAPGEWWESFDDDGLKTMAKAKSWKSPQELARSYSELEKRFGKVAGNPDKVLALPDQQTPEAMREIYKRLGLPESPEGYELKGDDAVLSNDELVKGFRQKAHELGLSKAQAETVYSWYVEQSRGLLEQTTSAAAQKAEAELTSLKTEWGAAYDERVALAQRAAKALGVSPELMDKQEEALGSKGLMEHYYNIGKNMKEDGLPGGGSPGNGKFSMSPDEARYQINQLKSDPAWRERYVNGDTEALREFKRLNAFANPS